MTEPDTERLVRRAAASLRQPHSGDAAAKDALIHAVHLEAENRRTSSAMSFPAWMLAAAAITAFAIGLGAGRATVPAPLAPARRVATTEHAVEFVFVAPAARRVSLVGDFNGWDAAATPMVRSDGRSTWSVSVHLPPGRHVYAFVVDDSDWVSDPQAPLAPEHWFGQPKSVVVVGGDQRT